MQSGWAPSSQWRIQNLVQGCPQFTKCLQSPRLSQCYFSGASWAPPGALSTECEHTYPQIHASGRISATLFWKYGGTVLFLFLKKNTNVLTAPGTEAMGARWFQARMGKFGGSRLQSMTQFQVARRDYRIQKTDISFDLSLIRNCKPRWNFSKLLGL